MKRKLFIFFVILCIILACGLVICFNDNLKFKFTYEFYNNAEYSNGKTIRVSIPINNGITYLEGDQVIDFLKNGTGIVYFGYPTCPWCRNIIEILIDVSKKNNINKIYYVDSHSSNFDYDKVKKILNDYLDTDDNGEKRLYVPDVYFIKNGKILSHHISTVNSYKNPFEGMNDQQKVELENIYLNGIKLMEGNNNE